MPLKKFSVANLIKNFSEYLTIFIALIAISGAAVYYIYALNWFGLILSLILVGGAFPFFRSSLFLKKINPTENHYSKNDYLLLAIYGLVYLVMMVMLWQSRSDRALISPWPVINYNFFWLYALASALLITIANKKIFSTSLKLSLIAVHYFISFSVALIVYKIGYGFDPFIHRATMELIDTKGFVLPKPLYYLGEYSLVIITHKLSGFSIHFLNQILGPLLSACLLPNALYRFLKNNSVDTSQTNNLEKEPIFTTLIFLLVLTFSPFTLSTPQNLSYLFLILTVLNGLSKVPLRRVALLALATTAFHPLTGLPALAWLAWLIFKKYQNQLKIKTQKIVRGLIWLFSALGLPFSLFFAAGHSWKNFDASSFFAPEQTLINYPDPAGRETWILNFVYFFANNYALLLIIIISLVVFYCYRQRAQISDPKIKGLIFINSALLVAYLLSGQIRFDNLIDYEQAAYAERIPLIITIFFLPCLIVGLYKLILKIYQTDRLEQKLWLIFGLACLTISLYISYPRFDKYLNSHGYSTSANDLAAVRLIASQTTEPYIVLANQQVSAAALTEFGFDHYYQTATGPVYFYPIPTGGTLYQYYLDLVYKNPDRNNLTGACALTGVNQAYLIINKYWYQSSRIINEAKLEADNWWAINNEVYIFKYGC